jgi:hypothetical protein
VTAASAASRLHAFEPRDPTLLDVVHWYVHCYAITPTGIQTDAS